MKLKRVAAIGIVGGALAAWLAAAATSGDRAPVVSPPSSAPPIDARGTELATQIARLHERLVLEAAPRRKVRNPFQFAAARPQLTPPASNAALTDAPVVSAPPPPLRLSGLAEDPGPDGPVRTAIISGLGQLFLAKEGEHVTLRYRVTKIGADAVELTDLSDGSTLRLGFK